MAFCVVAFNRFCVSLAGSVCVQIQNDCIDAHCKYMYMQFKCMPLSTVRACFFMKLPENDETTRKLRCSVNAMQRDSHR